MHLVTLYVSQKSLWSEQTGPYMCVLYAEGVAAQDYTIFVHLMLAHMSVIHTRHTCVICSLTDD